MNEELKVEYLCARCRAPVDDFNLAEAEAEGFDAEECDILCRNCGVEKTLRMSIALALGQLEEAIGMVEDAGSDATPGLHAVLLRLRDYLVETTVSSEKARSARWTDIVSFIAGFVIVVVFALMVIDALPGPGP